MIQPRFNPGVAVLIPDVPIINSPVLSRVGFSSYLLISVISVNQ